MFLFVLKNNNVHGILNRVAPQLITNKEFTTLFTAALKKPAVIPVPSFVLQIFSEERAKIMLERQKVMPKCTTELGF